jgi:hypothetical protein
MGEDDRATIWLGGSSASHLSSDERERLRRGIYLKRPYDTDLSCCFDASGLL